MKPATRISSVNPSGAHLHVVSDRVAAGTPGIVLSGVSKTYRSRDGDVASLRPLDFHINAGEFFVVVGPSGCGKSTLLKMISGLLPPSSGEIVVEANGSPARTAMSVSCFRTRCCCRGGAFSPTSCCRST
jgi:NitT/TauT family transport system ATP-binding protein